MVAEADRDGRRPRTGTRGSRHKHRTRSRPSSARRPGSTRPRRRQNTIGSPGTRRNAITSRGIQRRRRRVWRTSRPADLTSRQPASPRGVQADHRRTRAWRWSAHSRGRDNPTSNSSCCDQKVIDLDGTSMAAPHVAGLVALIFQKNKILTFEQVRAHLQHSARIDGIPAAEVPARHRPRHEHPGQRALGLGQGRCARRLDDDPARGRVPAGAAGAAVAAEAAPDQLRTTGELGLHARTRSARG